MDLLSLSPRWALLIWKRYVLQFQKILFCPSFSLICFFCPLWNLCHLDGGSSSLSLLVFSFFLLLYFHFHLVTVFTRLFLQLSPLFWDFFFLLFSFSLSPYLFSFPSSFSSLPLTPFFLLKFKCPFVLWLCFSNNC